MAALGKEDFRGVSLSPHFMCAIKSVFIRPPSSGAWAIAAVTTLVIIWWLGQRQTFSVGKSIAGQPAWASCNVKALFTRSLPGRPTHVCNFLPVKARQCKLPVFLQDFFSSCVLLDCSLATYWRKTKWGGLRLVLSPNAMAARVSNGLFPGIMLFRDKRRTLCNSFATGN